MTKLLKACGVALLLGIALFMATPRYVSAQGPFSAQIQRAIASLQNGNTVFSTLSVGAPSGGFLALFSASNPTFGAPTVVRVQNTDTSATGAVGFDVLAGTALARILVNNQNFSTGPVVKISAQGGTNNVDLQFGTSSGAQWTIKSGVSAGAPQGNLYAATDNQYDIGDAAGTGRPRSLYLSAPAITPGTDDTTTVKGDVTRVRYQATITPATGGAGNCGTAFQAAALNADCTVGTLPAGQKLVGVYADVTVGFTCSGTCTGTKVVQCGTAAGGTQILAAGLNVAATGQFGLADADLGSGMTRAAAIQGGLLNSWSATTPVSCRFTSGTGNWGSGAATFVNAGSIKFTLITEQEK